VAIPENIQRLREILRDCTLCPRRCYVNRYAGEFGACGCGVDALVASAGAHFGEEPALVGRGGSGTIFLAGCNLRCLFCQNYDISQLHGGRPVAPPHIAETALRLQADGCENVNFVTPTHVAHAVAETVSLAREAGLTVPVVYNCGGYESVETLGLLGGLVEIYMPDFKYADAAAGEKYSGVANYPAVAAEALAEMFRQVGTLATNHDGVATRGVLVRHLVMPADLACSREVIDTVARVAPGCAINVMAQYHPAYRAGERDELLAEPSPQEVRALREHATARGLVRVD